MHKKCQSESCLQSINEIFLNKPVNDECLDITDVGTHVNKINNAINEGAQMIAVTSPFGGGKTSVTDLLKQKRKNNKKENFIKISMWSQLSKIAQDGKINSIDLHRSFLYQLASQIKTKYGTYIIQRLSGNYGLLKLNILNPFYVILAVLVGILLLFPIFIDYFCIVWPKLNNYTDLIKVVCIIVAMSISIIVGTRSEIIFSSKKSEGTRTIDDDEIMDLYRNLILKKYNCFTKCSSKKYIVIVEDLDRTDDTKIVLDFLKELRKYYIIDDEEGNKKRYQNSVVFIINIKPESYLLDLNNINSEKSHQNENKNKNQSENDNNKIIIKENESLYAKLFDYTLNLQTINIDNYDSILKGLLEQHKDYLQKLSLLNENEVLDIKGIQWIIREPKLGIREIKKRLNTAFSLYESLTNKFPNSNIEFEKCTVVAYLTTAFEKEFYYTDDRAFQKLIELNLKNQLNKESEGILPDNNELYVKTVTQLIKSKKIDVDYRTYFYNYPKNSYLYSVDESKIFQAIVYNEQYEDLEEIVIRNKESKVFKDSLDKLNKLNLPLPKIVFDIETLYLIAYEEQEDKVFKFFENLDYSDEAILNTISFYKKVLGYDINRNVYTESFANKISKIWEEKLKESDILNLRSFICETFPDEAVDYIDLFFGGHNMISKHEINKIKLSDAIDLMNTEHPDFSYTNIQDIIDKYYIAHNQSDTERVVGFIYTNLSKIYDYQYSLEELDTNIILQCTSLCLDFMINENMIYEDLENLVADNFICIDDFRELEIYKNITDKYKILLNSYSNNHKLSDRSIEYLCKINDYCELDVGIINELYERRLYLEYVYSIIDNNLEIDYKDINIIENIKNNINKFSNDKPRFMFFRENLVKEKKAIVKNYMFLFTNETYLITKNEMKMLNYYHKYEDIIDFICPQLVEKEDATNISDFYNTKYHDNTTSYKLLLLISKMQKEVAYNLFYNLNFENIRYRSFSQQKKYTLKRILNSPLMLDTVEGKLKFMSETQYLDKEWENDISDDVLNDKHLFQMYLNTINNCKNANDETAKILSNYSYMYPLKDDITDKLFKIQEYRYYIYSKTEFNGAFNIDNNKKRAEILWKEYLKIFNSNSPAETAKKMANNLEFLNLIIEKHDYVGMSERSRAEIAKVYQDSECLIDVMNYDNDFILDYFSNIVGFKDKQAAETFLDLVTKNNFLLKSDDVYYNTHNKLLDSVLKSKYTKARNKYLKG